jgi:hypothetical protein
MQGGINMINKWKRRDFLRTTGILALGAATTGHWWPALAAPTSIPMRDVIIILPGITGSVLRKDGHDIWAVSAIGIFGALTSLGRNLNTLKLTEDPPDIDDLSDGVIADRLVNDLHLDCGKLMVTPS